MDSYFLEGPIVACSTGQSEPCALSVIRLSGFSDSFDFRPLIGKSLLELPPRKAVLTKVKSEKGQAIDQVLVLKFSRPESFTGENLLEIHCHGNPLIVTEILDHCLYLGMREASPGEFSFRAYRNKKLSLTQVEGLNLLIHSDNPFALEQGRSLLNGDLDKDYKRVRDSLLHHKASLELLLDFHEDVGEEAATTHLHNSFQELKVFAENFIRRSETEVDLQRPKVVLMGRTNAGKSSLFNLLLGRKRAIVSPSAGTTRDYLDGTYPIGGSVFRLIDTAGLRETENVVEQEGIGLSRELAETAFYRIAVVDSRDDFNEQELRKILADDYDCLILSHKDLCSRPSSIPVLEKQAIPVLLLNLNEPLSRSGRLKIEKSILTKFHQSCDQRPLVLPRHRRLWRQFSRKLKEYEKILKGADSDLGILSHHLFLLEKDFEAILGVFLPDEVLNEIFANFCIGK